MKKISGLYPENVYIYAKKERRHNIYYRTLLEASSSVYFMYAKSGREARAPGPWADTWPRTSGLLKAWPWPPDLVHRSPGSPGEAWPPENLLKAWPPESMEEALPLAS